MASALRSIAAGAVAAGVAAPLVRHRLGLPPIAVSLLAWQAPLALVLACPPSRRRAAGVYTVQMLAYMAHYDMPDDDPDALRRRLRVIYPIRADTVIGLGETPTVRLQRSLGRRGRVLAHDTVLS